MSTPEDNGGMRRMPRDIGEVSVYVPGLRIPKPVDFSPPLGSNLSWNLVQLLTTLRTRIAVLAGEGVPTAKRSTGKNATQHGLPCNTLPCFLFLLFHITIVCGLNLSTYL